MSQIIFSLFVSLSVLNHHRQIAYLYVPDGQLEHVLTESAPTITLCLVSKIIFSHFVTHFLPPSLFSSVAAIKLLTHLYFPASHSAQELASVASLNFPAGQSSQPDSGVNPLPNTHEFWMVI